MTKKPSDFSDIDRALFTGIHGPVEIKKEERRRYLGELKERVVCSLTSSQMAKPTLDKGFVEATDRDDISHIVLSGKIAFQDWVNKYRQRANEKDLPVRTVNDPELRGDVRLIVVQKQC
ncbi:uncharacterized protein YueI [Desulfitispora alkaliphila]|uniref:DUF1694 domain-containing protein n=1 Tax=Desulfitispora alkaliphila TaxID=622674 RepID=UPI003D234838